MKTVEDEIQAVGPSMWRRLRRYFREDTPFTAIHQQRAEAKRERRRARRLRDGEHLRNPQDGPRAGIVYTGNAMRPWYDQAGRDPWKIAR